MNKLLIILIFLMASVVLNAGSEFDKDITVLNQTRDEKVTKVFKEMMATYDDENVDDFFQYVSEDRFIQDYMLFYDAIELDMRVYDTLSIDTWIDKITEDGVKRFLYVRWEKRYLSTLGDSDTEIVQRGYSRFLFDEVNGKYKLIELAGNNFWGESSPEWKEEVPQIAGQEPETSKVATSTGVVVTGLPDLTVSILDCSGGYIYFTLNNEGAADTTAGSIEYEVYDGSLPATNAYTYNGDITAGTSTGTISQSHNCDAVYGGSVTADPNDLIDESDETNNQESI